MDTPVIVTLPHQLGRAEARRRIDNGFAKITQTLPGSAGSASQRWEGDRLVFAIVTLGQRITGVIDVLDASVRIEIELPGVLGMLARGLKDRLRSAGQLLLTKK